VAARRLILVMLVLLVLSSIFATLLPVDRDRLSDESSTSTTSTTEQPKPKGGELIRRTIAAGDPTPERIELGLDDQLELTVTSAKLSDLVEIPAFGELEYVDPDFPVHFDLLALETGSFDVRLVDAHRVIARIDVSAQKSKDSPGSSTNTSTPGASSES
jgi:hypothetical protein